LIIADHAFQHHDDYNRVLWQWGIPKFYWSWIKEGPKFTKPEIIAKITGDRTSVVFLSNPENGAILEAFKALVAVNKPASLAISADRVIEVTPESLAKKQRVVVYAVSAMVPKHILTRIRGMFSRHTLLVTFAGSKREWMTTFRYTPEYFVSVDKRVF